MEAEQWIRFGRLIFLALVPYVLASQGTMLSGRFRNSRKPLHDLYCYEQ